MPKVAVYDMTGKQTGEIELNDNVFGIEVNEPVLHQAVVMQLANQRLGTAATKTRGFVRGGGRKPWKQKGTGRARSGSIRSPLWVGGGVVFGPQPRSYAIRMPRKVRRLAIKSALSAKLGSGDLIIVDTINFAEPKTKLVINMLAALNAADTKALIVTGQQDEVVEKSARNIPGVKTIVSNCLNVYDLLYHGKLLITKEAVSKIEEVLA